LLYRRQFVLGPRILESLSSWRQKQIGADLFVQTHPDLAVTQVKDRDFQLTLLGYAIDPDNPDDTDTDILTKLISRINTAKDIFRETYRMGGRWILIVVDSTEIILFNDPCGQRQVIYTDSQFAEPWCASQPGIIAEEFNLHIDKQAEKEFINVQCISPTREYWWPGDSTGFNEIKHLLPNHYLDVRTRTCHRFWPHDKINRLPLDEGAEKGSQLLKNIITSASNRYNLGFTLTAGWDTRLLLAATREVARDVYYFTMIYGSLTEKSCDLQVPKRLLGKLGLTHNTIQCPCNEDDEFKRIYKHNVFTAHERVWENIARGLYEHYPRDRVCIRGAISSQIVKPYSAYSTQMFANYKTEREVTAQSMAKHFHMETTPFILNHLEKWLSEAKPVAENSDFNIVELFGWEQLTGKWQAMSQLESDIAFDILVPYNCRALLETLLSVE